jgi:hypothetical protein
MNSPLSERVEKAVSEEEILSEYGPKEDKDSRCNEQQDTDDVRECH